jgi:hypothetical protein
MVSVIKSFKIEKNVADNLEQLICSNTFPWYFNDVTVYNVEGKINHNENYDGFQFVHGLYRDQVPTSTFFNNIVPVLTSFKELQFEYFKRIKLNLNLKSHNEYVHLPIHIDISPSIFTSMIYYVNDSDGDTLFFDKQNNIIERVSPEKGKVIYFRSNIPHAAQNPVKNNKRVIINFIGIQNV